MDKKFTSNDVPLSQLLDQAHAGTVQLPDFQRGWVWDDNHIVSLLASVSLSFPIGAVMTLRTGNPDVKFKPRVLQGVELGRPAEPEFLLLDGQQRTTSLYLALRSSQAVATRDSRGKELQRRYFADIRHCIDPVADREEQGIVALPADGVVRNFRGEVIRDVSTRAKQIEAELFPLNIVLDSSETATWQLEFMQSGDIQERLATWISFQQAVVEPFVQYRIPVIELTRDTPKEAVCQVFEKVNTGGVSLGVFELLTATYAADNVNLREDWAARRAVFDNHQLLEEFGEDAFLQIVTLLATRDRGPAVSCKRKDILKLPLPDYQRWADVVSDTLPTVVKFLYGENIFLARDLPYGSQLVPLTAIMVSLSKKAEGLGVAHKLRRWYWCGVFGKLYGGATETRFANDLPEVLAWVDGGDEPRTVRESQFQAERLLTLRTRNSAAYKGLYAQQLQRGGRDFRTGMPVTLHAFLDEPLDVHHIFPKRWYQAQDGIQDDDANCIVNKTSIDAHTNRRIGGRAPSRYLAALESHAEIAPEGMDAILRSHDIDPVALRNDDFTTFFNSRFERLLAQIESATGKQVNRNPDRSESPYSDIIEDTAEAVHAIIAAGESGVVEFKSTAWKNLTTGERDSAIEWAVLETVAAFLNSSGGTLLVGIADDGKVIGIEEDYPIMGAKKNTDGWELRLIDALNRSLGKPAATDVIITYAELDGRTVARVTAGPAAKPVFASPVKGEKKPAFYVRINSATHELHGQDAFDYQHKRWPQSG